MIKKVSPVEKITKNNLIDFINQKYDIMYNKDSIKLILKKNNDFLNINDNITGKDNINTKNTKKAIFMCGLARFSKISLKYQYDNIIDKNNDDIFLCFWDIDGSWKKNKNYKLSYNNEYLNDNKIDMDCLNEIIINYKPKSIGILNYSDFNKHQYQTFLEINKINVNASEYGENYLKMIIDQTYLLYYNLNMFRQYTSITKINYTYYIRLRLDNLILAEPNYKLLDKYDMIIPSFNSHPLSIDNIHISINDQLCITDKISVFEKYMSIYNYLTDIINYITKNDEKFIGNPIIKFFTETYFGIYLLKLNNFKIIEDNMSVGLLRKTHVKFLDKTISKILSLSDFKEYVKGI